MIYEDNLNILNEEKVFGIKIDKKKLNDEDYVKDLINKINEKEKTAGTDSIIGLILMILGVLSLLTVIGIPAAFLLISLSFKVNKIKYNIQARDLMKIDSYLQKSIKKLKKSYSKAEGKDKEKYEKLIKDLEKNRERLIYDVNLRTDKRVPREQLTESELKQLSKLIEKELSVVIKKYNSNKKEIRNAIERYIVNFEEEDYIKNAIGKYYNSEVPTLDCYVVDYYTNDSSIGYSILNPKHKETEILSEALYSISINIIKDFNNRIKSLDISNLIHNVEFNDGEIIVSFSILKCREYLQSITENYNIEEGNEFMSYNNIYEEYMNIINSLDTIDESLINRDISLLPVYKVNEGFLKRLREKIRQRNLKTNNKEIDTEIKVSKGYEDVPYKKIKVNSKSSMAKLYAHDSFCIECAPKEEEFPQFIANLLGNNYEINTPVEMYVVTGKDFNKAYDLAGENAYQDTVMHLIIPLTTIKDSNQWSTAKIKLHARYFRDVVDNNEYREYIAGRHKKSPQIQWLIDTYTRNESYIIGEYTNYTMHKYNKKIDKADKAEKDKTLKDSSKIVKLKIKCQEELEKFNKMTKEQQEKYIKKQNVKNIFQGAIRAGLLSAEYAISYDKANGLDKSITVNDYKSELGKIIKKANKLINDHSDRLEKEIYNVKKESYCVDLDVLKHVSESQDITLEESMELIKEVNEIESSDIYCVLPKDINENMTLESFINLVEKLSESNINIAYTKELKYDDFCQ